MDANRYLSQIAMIQKKIKQKRKRLKDLREASTAVGGFATDNVKVMSSTNTKSRVERDAVSIADLSAEIIADIVNLETLKCKLEDDIHDLEDVRFVDVLDRRYIQGQRIEKIAVEMNYSYDYIRQIKKQALSEFERVHPEIKDWE